MNVFYSVQVWGGGRGSPSAVVRKVRVVADSFLKVDSFSGGCVCSLNCFVLAVAVILL